MTVAQFELLSELTGQPDRPQAELADHVGIDQTTLSRNLKAMISYGWLTSAPSLKDKRQTRYALTTKGQKILQLAIPHWQQAHDHVLKQMGPDWQTAWDQLSRLTLALSI